LKSTQLDICPEIVRTTQQRLKLKDFHACMGIQSEKEEEGGCRWGQPVKTRGREKSGPLVKEGVAFSKEGFKIRRAKTIPQTHVHTVPAVEHPIGKRGDSGGKKLKKKERLERGHT